MLQEILRAAQVLVDAKCDIMVFHCTASALLAAFAALGARRLVFVSPYRQQTNDHELAFLAEAGLKVVRDRALSLLGSDGYVTAPASLFLEATLAAVDPRADAYCLSCTNIRSLEVIQELEAHLDRPVVTSNQATLWYCLRVCGLDDDVASLGRLFRLGQPVGVAAR
jgi:maleate isomerase